MVLNQAENTLLYMFGEDSRIDLFWRNMWCKLARGPNLEAHAVGPLASTASAVEKRLLFVHQPTKRPDDQMTEPLRNESGHV